MTSEVERVREMLTLGQVLAMIPVRPRLPVSAGARGPGSRKAIFVSARKKLWFRDEVVKWQHDLADPNSELSKAVRSKLSKAKRRLEMGRTADAQASPSLGSRLHDPGLCQAHFGLTVGKVRRAVKRHEIETVTFSGLERITPERGQAGRGAVWA